MPCKFQESCVCNASHEKSGKVGRKQHKIRMRQAAYVRAISRIVLAMRFRGIWP